LSVPAKSADAMLALLSAAPAVYSSDQAWGAKAWKVNSPKDAKSTITMDLSAFEKLKTPKGETSNVWHAATDSRSRGAASYANVMIGEDGAEQFGIMYSKRPMSGTEMPHADDQIAIYMPSTSGGRSLERGGSITFAPVTTDMSSARAIAAARSNFEKEDHDLERKMYPFYPIVDPVTATLAWGAWGAYLAAGFLPAFAATMPADLEASVEVSRAVAVKRHSKQLHMVTKDKVVSFKNAAELERKMYLPLLAAPLFFYPWGFAYGAAYFAVTSAAAAIAPVVQPFMQPYLDWMKADHTALYKDLGTTAMTWMKSYWGTYFWVSISTYWWWMWVYYTVYWQPAIVKWYFEVYKYWYDYWTKAMGSSGIVPGAIASSLPSPTPTPASAVEQKM